MDRETKLHERVSKAEQQQEHLVNLAGPIALTALVVSIAVLGIISYSTARGGSIPAPFRPIVVICLVLSMIPSLLYLFFHPLMIARSRMTLVKERRFAAEALRRLRVLQSEHPELAQLDALRELLEEDRAQAEVRRNRRDNFYFTLLGAVMGIALTIIATKMGWL